MLNFYQNYGIIYTYQEGDNQHLAALDIDSYSIHVLNIMNKIDEFVKQNSVIVNNKNNKEEVLLRIVLPKDNLDGATSLSKGRLTMKERGPKWAKFLLPTKDDFKNVKFDWENVKTITLIHYLQSVPVTSKNNENYFIISHRRPLSYLKSNKLISGNAGIDGIKLANYKLGIISEKHYSQSFAISKPPLLKNGNEPLKYQIRKKLTNELQQFDENEQKNYCKSLWIDYPILLVKSDGTTSIMDVAKAILPIIIPNHLIGSVLSNLPKLYSNSIKCQSNEGNIHNTDEKEDFPSNGSPCNGVRTKPSTSKTSKNKGKTMKNKDKNNHKNAKRVHHTQQKNNNKKTRKSQTINNNNNNNSSDDEDDGSKKRRKLPKVDDTPRKQRKSKNKAKVKNKKNVKFSEPLATTQSDDNDSTRNDKQSQYTKHKNKNTKKKSKDKKNLIESDEDDSDIAITLNVNNNNNNNNSEDDNSDISDQETSQSISIGLGNDDENENNDENQNGGNEIDNEKSSESEDNQDENNDSDEDEENEYKYDEDQSDEDEDDEDEDDEDEDNDLDIELLSSKKSSKSSKTPKSSKTLKSSKLSQSSKTSKTYAKCRKRKINEDSDRDENNNIVKLSTMKSPARKKQDRRRRQLTPDTEDDEDEQDENNNNNNNNSKNRKKKKSTQRPKIIFDEYVK